MSAVKVGGKRGFLAFWYGVMWVADIKRQTRPVCNAERAGHGKTKVKPCRPDLFSDQLRGRTDPPGANRFNKSRLSFDQHV